MSDHVALPVGPDRAGRQRSVMLGTATARRRLKRIGFGVVIGALAGATIAPGVQANHSWGTYHWARTSNPFTLKVGDNVSGAWDASLSTAISDWSQATPLNLTGVAGSAGSKQCRPPSGRVEVCNGNYGYTGWLGVAQIWLSGSHIVQGSVKLNDSYYSSGTYNTTAWRALVTCQELGHTLGLDHQDEDFYNNNLGTCMDYTNSPGTNQHPNSHDYNQLATIYTHLDASTTVGSAGYGGALALVASIALGHESDPEWGGLVSVSRDGHQSMYARPTGPDSWLLTHVTWAEERVPAR